MIFVTVGAQMPFDRLVRAVDAWAGERGRRDVFAQIGKTDLRPAAIEWSPFIRPDQFRDRVRESTAIVAHAGMGSILTALQYGKPILVMPRRGDLRETRNDHQVATAQRFKAMGRVEVALDESEIPSALDRIGHASAAAAIAPYASDELLSAIRRFIHEDQRP